MVPNKYQIVLWIKAFLPRFRCYNGTRVGNGEAVNYKPIDLPRIMQACAALLKRAPGRSMSRMELLKRLYIADRESIRLSGHSISGDRHAALELGPILSVTYNMIKGKVAAEQWSRHFESSGRDVILKHDPGIDELSSFDMQILDRISEQFKSYSAGQLSKFTHQFAEYKKNDPKGKTSKEIPFADILDAVGQLDQKEQIEAEERSELAVRRLIAKHSH